MNHLSDSVFSVKACGNIAKELSKLYKMKAIKSVHHLVKHLHELTHKSFSHVISKTKMISEHENNPTPEFYYFNHQLISALKEKKDISLATRVIEDFSLKPHQILIKEKILVENINQYQWAREFMDSTVLDANKINGENFSKIIPVNDSELACHVHLINLCLQNLDLQFHTQAFFKEMHHYISHIILYDGMGITGASSTRTMGSIYIRIAKQERVERDKIEPSSISLTHLPCFVYYLEQLVHETAHLHLDQLMAFDPLVLNSDQNKYSSPIRKDSRPMRGILHATYVLARLLLFYNGFNFKSDWSEESKNKRISAIKKALSRGLFTLNTSASLTDRGKSILIEMGDLLKNGE